MKGLIIAPPPGLACDWTGEERPAGSLPLPGGQLLGEQITWLIERGAAEVLVLAYHLPGPLETLVARAAKEGVSVRLALGSSWQGLAAALRLAGGFVDQTTLVVVDPILPRMEIGPALEAHQEHQALCSLLVPAGEAPGLSLAVGLLEPRLLAEDLAGATWEELATALRDRDRTVLVSECEGRCWALGDPLAHGRALLELLPGGIAIDRRARVHPAARLSAPVSIGPGCKVAKDARLGPGVYLEAGVEVQRGAEIAHTAVLGACRIGRASRWTNRLIVPDGSWSLEAPGALEAAHPDELREVSRFAWSSQGLDQLLATLGLVLLSPLLLLVALAIYLDDPGPVLYTQLRVGQRPRGRRAGAYPGRVFELYKFRTMVLDAEERRAALQAQNRYGEGAFFKLEADPRITRIGRLLRSTSLDELPQLLNVIQGDMRLVGNRPLPLYEAEALKEPWQRVRFACPAGITGLWQISGRSDLSEAERMVLDSYYAVSRTFWADWWILARTLPALLLRRGAR